MVESVTAGRDSWTAKLGGLERMEKNSCNSRKIAGNKQDVRRNYNKTVESMWGDQQA